MRSKSRVGDAGLLLALFLSAVLQTFVFVLLPALSRQLQLTAVQSAAVASVGALIAIIAAPFWGRIAETRGRRSVALVALFGLTSSAAFFAIILRAGITGAIRGDAIFALLILTRACQSSFGPGLIPAAEGRMADISTAGDRTRAMGLMSASLAVGGLGGVLLVWAAAPAEPALLFAGTAMLLIVAAALVSTVRELPQPAEDRARPSQLLRPILPFIAVTAIGAACISMVQQMTTFRLQDSFGYSQAQAASASGAILAGGVGAMIASQLAFATILKWPPARLLTAGSLTALLAMLGLALAATTAAVMIATAALGLGLGMLQPGNLAAISWRTPRQCQARAAGMNFVGQGVGFASGPLLGAYLGSVAPSTPYIAGASLLTIAATLCATMRRSLCTDEGITALIRSPEPPPRLGNAASRA